MNQNHNSLIEVRKSQKILRRERERDEVEAVNIERLRERERDEVKDVQLLARLIKVRKSEKSNEKR